LTRQPRCTLPTASRRSVSNPVAPFPDGRSMVWSSLMVTNWGRRALRATGGAVGTRAAHHGGGAPPAAARRAAGGHGGLVAHCVGPRLWCVVVAVAAGGGGSLRERTHRCVSHTSLMHIDVSYTRLMHIDVSFTRLMCRTRTPDDEAARVSGRANTASWVYRRRLTGRLWNTASCLTAAPLTREAAGVCGGGAGEAAFVLKAAHAARVRAVEVLPSADGRDNSHLFASASSDGVVRVWDSRMVSSSDTCAPAATMARPPSLRTGYTQGWYASR
jgi:hypothetical protein